MTSLTRVWTPLFLLAQSTCCWAQYLPASSAPPPPKIAVIGGGIGGTSAAHFLHELFGDEALVDVYEAGQVGGRLATLEIGGRDYEVGGSIIHPRNKYMMDFAAKFGLKHKSATPSLFGLYNGQEYVLRESSWAVETIIKLVWRYGWDVYRLQSLTHHMLGQFERIYTLQSQGQAFTDVATLLKAMDPSFEAMTHVSAREWLQDKQGMGHRMVDELVMAVTQANYGQTPSVHAFLGAISVAGADPNLWAVSGGNRRVPEELLRESRATLLSRAVTQVTPSSSHGFKVTSVESENASDLFSEGSRRGSREESSSPHTSHSHEYDLVIIATPLTADKQTFKLVNFTKQFEFPGRYEQIACTMVQGKLRPKAINLEEGDGIDEILVTNPALAFNSIGKQTPTVVEEGMQYPDVWKIFSPIPLTEAQLDKLFEVRNSTHLIDWLAYPHYSSDQQLGEFELLPGLYHTSAIEWAGSAMEMSIIGAKNTALLAYKYWLQDLKPAMNAPQKDEL